MAELTFEMPDGTSRTATVDDGIKNLSSADQAAFVGRMRQSALGQSGAGAAAHSTPDTSLGSALQFGAHNAVTGVGQTVSDVGSVLPDSVGGYVKGAGDWLQGHAPSSPEGYQPVGSEVGASLRQGRLLDAAKGILRQGVETAPDVAATLLAARAGGGAGALAYQGARNFGPTAAARAANNGRSEPNSQDMLEALPGTAAQSAAGMLGAVVPGAGQIASPLLRLGAQTGAEVLAGGAGNVAAQLGNTVGTAKGASVDTDQAIGAAAGAGAARAGIGSMAPAKAVLKAGTDQIMARAQEVPATTEGLQSITRTAAAMKQLQAENPGMSATQAANNVKQNLQNELTARIEQAKASGALSDEDFGTLQNVVGNLAYRHNNAATEDDIQSAFGSLNLPEKVTGPMMDAARDLNTVSSQSFIKNTTGPFATAGGLIGKYGGAVSGALHGNLPMAIGSLVGGGKVGSLAGGLVDRGLGLNTPPVVLQAIRARQLLAARGLSPDGEASLPALQGTRDLIPPPPAPQEAPAAPFGVFGKNPNPAPVMNAMRAQGQQSLQPAPAPGFIRPTIETPTPNPAPAFIRPTIETPTPNPAPAFIRPTIETPTPNPAPPFIRPAPPAPNPVPGFVRPDIPTPETNPVPPFLRPTVQAPSASPAPPFIRPPVSAPAPATGGPAPNPAVLRASLVAKAQAILEAQQENPAGQPDLETGLPRNPVPIGVPVKSPALPPTLPSALKVNTPADVRAAIQGDDGIAPVPPPGATPQAVRPPPGINYLSRDLPAVAPAQMVQKAGELEQAGIVYPGFTAHLQDPSMAPPKGPLDTLKAALQGQPTGHQGYAVEHSVQARTNAANYQTGARALAASDPVAASAILDIAQRGKSPTEKQAIAAEWISKNPALAGHFPPFLLDHGHRG